MFDIDSFSFFSFGPVVAPSATGHSFLSWPYGLFYEILWDKGFPV